MLRMLHYSNQVSPVLFGRECEVQQIRVRESRASSEPGDGEPKGSPAGGQSFGQWRHWYRAKPIKLQVTEYSGLLFGILSMLGCWGGSGGS